MNKAAFFLLAAILLLSCRSKSPSLDEEDFDLKVNMSEAVQIEAQLWRNLMPMVGGEADRSLQMDVIFRLPAFIDKEQVHPDSVLVDKGDEQWTALFTTNRWEAKRRQLHSSASGGPEWRVETKVELTVYFRLGNEPHVRRLSGAEIMGTY